MKKLFSPIMNFKMKSGFVIAEGDWNRFSLSGHDVPTLLLHNQEEWQDLVLSQSNDNMSPSKAMNNPLIDVNLLSSMPGILSRKEIEQYMGKSRATMNRFLKRWEEEGLVKREGHARSTRYHLSQEVISILKGSLS
jgi:hypothetical protein